MIYKILDVAKLNFTNEQVFYFDDEHVHVSPDTGFYEHIMEVGDVLQPYVPTTAEATQWLEMSKGFEGGITEELQDIEYYRQYLGAVVLAAAANFEDNLNKDMYFTSSLKFKVNGDRRTRDNIQDLITFFDAQQQEGKISYRDYDNKEQKLTKENLQTILVEHVTNGQNLYKQKWEKQQKIQAAQSFDDLKAVSTEFEMSDFRGGQNNGLIPLG